MQDYEKLFFKANWPAEQLAEMNMKVSDSFNPYFQMQNKFADQSLHNNLAAEYSDQNGVQSVYFVASLYNPTTQDIRGTVYREDPVQVMERVFHAKIVGDETIPADKIKFGKFVFEGLDEFTIYLHRDAFFMRNFNSLKQAGVAPELDPALHSPSFSGRGGERFNYKGYSAGQIFPKESDLIKPEWSGKLYEVSDVRTEIPDQSFLQRRYFFALTLRQYRDDNRTVIPAVEMDGFNTDQFINEMFGSGTIMDNGPVIQNQVIPIETPTTATSGVQLLGTTWSLGAGWTGDNTIGFTHIGGNTAILAEPTTYDRGNVYLVSWTITNRTAGSISISVGGLARNQITVSANFIEAMLSGTSLIVTPSSDFNGTVKFKIALSRSEHNQHWQDLTNKDSVLYRPPQITDVTKNISDASNYRPRPFGDA